MLVEIAGIREKIRRIVTCFVSNPWLQQDLYQEALLHLWKTERRLPGQTISWYLQSCRFRIQHLLNAGRSIDAHHRDHQRLEPPGTDDLSDHVPEHDELETVVSAVCAREMQKTVLPHLTEMETQSLSGLVSGSTTREIFSLSVWAPAPADMPYQEQKRHRHRVRTKHGTGAVIDFQ